VEEKRQAPDGDERPAKKPYAAPEIVEYGSVASISDGTMTNSQLKSCL
jgi:hypothetical protein